ncbi:hypothetical protein CCHOA_06005 [Corynebacterium choanae]|uniref:Uncharacterized protein n=1 Tax=Corynebacterium choanae TaxID=1862358 RepID=A0A3G6JAT6_9CORY|nr:hypothetical protein CCHOA_06005 [Corynebacterium choanae]
MSPNPTGGVGAVSIELLSSRPHRDERQVRKTTTQILDASMRGLPGGIVSRCRHCPVLRCVVATTADADMEVTVIAEASRLSAVTTPCVSSTRVRFPSRRR